MESKTAGFASLFSIRAEHSYFKNGACAYVTLEPDLATQGKLKSLRLISKSSEGEIKILAPASGLIQDDKAGQQPPETLGESQHFIFLIKIKDNALFKISKLDFRDFPKKALYYYNHLDDNKLSVEKCGILDDQLVIEYDKETVPVSEKILWQDNQEVYRTNVNQSATGFRFSLMGYQSGVYTVATDFAKKNQRTKQLFYYSPNVRKERIIGIVDVYLSDKMRKEKEENRTFVISLEG